MSLEIEVDSTWIALFKSRAEAVGAKVYLVASMAEAADCVAERVTAHESSEIGLAPAQFEQTADGWQSFLEALAAKVRLKACETAGDIAATPVGLSYADLAVAETGSLVFASNDLRSRLVAMLTYVNVAVVEASKMVEGLDQVSEQLSRWQAGKGSRRYVSMVTGPSRTADIERVLTIGVQGPQELHIVLVK